MSLVPTRPSRRTFLKHSAALSGVFVLGIQGTNAVAADAAEVTHWVVIAPDDTVTIRIARSELGQGTFTGLAQLVAEELGCEWSKVRAEYADVNEHIRRNKIWKDMSTGGSRGIRDSHDYVRKGGAAARMMLIAAAAQRWGVPVTECRAERGVVIHSSGKTLRYGELATLASTLPVPENPPLKSPKECALTYQPRSMARKCMPRMFGYPACCMPPYCKARCSVDS
jgi:isoquinoline 1-oxidoreductase beta subunit